MLNLFRSKKDPGKSAASKPAARRGQPASSNRTGSRVDWFGGRSQKPAARTNNIKSIQIRATSSPVLNNATNEHNVYRRPLTIHGGQQTSKIDAQTPEDLSRASSISNLNANERAKGGAKPKKAESKDKLDKLSEKRNDKKAARNNNKEAVGDSLTELEALQRQLEQMSNDKTSLALQLGEQTGQLNKLHQEVAHLKMLHEESAHKVEQLAEENTILRNRLRDVSHSPLSDNEKQQLLYESQRHSSAPASIATNLLDDGNETACPTPEWDKHSSGNVSDVSVACLQDKINQMQETHYSTNEELQATLQELTDLQRQLTELQQENLRLSDEKNLMFESLCRQTERLNDSRSEVESLKQLLCKDESGQFETAAEREQKLLDLLKSAQEERESLLVKQEQLDSELEDSRATNDVQIEDITQLSERVKTLESTLDAKHAEHKLLDQELAQAKDQSSGRQIEINRLKDLLENARTKIGELEQDRALSDKSELDEMLDNARKEKDALESEVAHLKEQLALSKNEAEKLKEQVSILQEECKVTRNNAKTTQSDLEYKLEKVVAEKNALSEQLQQFQEAVNELQVQAQCQLDDKRQLSTVLAETQRNLNEAERRIVELENELGELKKIKAEQEEEWEKFQNDLLTSVRVANEFKTEAHQEVQKLALENKAGREKIKQLETQLDKLKGGKQLTGEEALMASLNRRYRAIEPITDDQLTAEERAVKVLKRHYDASVQKQKPVARKPKDRLAISKPSLDSVIANPKLGRIVDDVTVSNVEERVFQEEVRASLLEDLGPAIGDVCWRQGTRSDCCYPSAADENDSEASRSKSLSDLPKFAEPERSLRRYDSTDNLVVLTGRKSRRRKKSTVNLNTLERIVKGIDPNLSDDELTNEQRLALRLKKFLSGDEANKSSLKKVAKLRQKKVVITRPTVESVESNAKLREIIGDPVIPNAEPQIVKRETRKRVGKVKDTYSMPVSGLEAKSGLKPTKSKSYNDINFKFRPIFMYGEQEAVPQVQDVLPPEDFRDVPPSVVDDNSAFATFRTEDNTFKKFECEAERVWKQEELSQHEDDVGVPEEQFETNETLNAVIIRRLEEDDDLIYAELDEEDRRARRGTRQRYSHVIGEMKDKFEEERTEGDGASDVAKVPFIKVNDEEFDQDQDKESTEVLQVDKEDDNAVVTSSIELIGMLNNLELKYGSFLDETASELEEDNDLIIAEEYANVGPKIVAEYVDSGGEDVAEGLILEEIVEEDNGKDEDTKSVENEEKIVEEDNSKDEDTKSIEEVQKSVKIDEEKMYLFTQDEVDLIEKYSRRSSRPLSDISALDLELVEILKHQYENEDLEDTTTALQQQDQDKKHGIELLTQSDDASFGSEEKQTVEDDNLIEKHPRRPSTPLSDITLMDLRQNEDENLEKADIAEVKTERPLSDLSLKDFVLVESLKQECDDSGEEKIQERHTRILSPTKLNDSSTYEPVYANFFVSSNRTSTEFSQTSVAGKKPIAAPRYTSSYDGAELYSDLGGQMRKTRFSITYDRKKGDSFKEHHQETSVRVKDLRSMFEKRSKH